MKFTRVSPVPVIAPRTGTFCAEGATTADVLRVGDSLHVVFGGVRGGHERIGCVTLPSNGVLRPPWDVSRSRVLVDVGGPGSFDAYHVADPAIVRAHDKIYLYYSALGEGPDSIGLAVSADGRSFEKRSRPILVGRAPSVHYENGLFYLFFVRPNSSDGYEIFLATSQNGVEFKVYENPVLRPIPGAFASRTVTTPCVFRYGRRFGMVYAGDDETRDTPKGLGLAWSEDLASWEPEGTEPVFRRGPEGAWDGSGIWCGTVFEHDGTHYLLYEGMGWSRDLQREASQVGLARLDP